MKDEQTHAGDANGIGSAADATIAPTTTAAKPTRGLRAGERVENYELISILGSGGMGVVWKAVDTNNGRHVALKRLSSNHLSDQDSVTRFKREAQLASKISHPRVTFVYSAGQLEEQPFIAMELMPGETLDDRVKQDGPLPIGEAVDKILDVIDGLEAAHSMGLIHRDVKPSNCFIDSDERVKIGDFGLSKSVVSSDVELTRTGTFMGTPAYAAPEQIRGEKLDHRTDIYAVGATLCCLLTGRPPFVGDAMTVTAQIVTDTPKISDELPRELTRILRQCLEKNREKRFQSLSELRNALLPFAQSSDSLAAIGRRVSAYMIDAVLVATAIGICMTCIGVYAGIMAQVKKIPVEDMLQPIAWISPVIGFIVPFSYFFLLEGAMGKTIGKRLLSLKVIDKEGAKPSWGRAFLRTFFIPGGAAVPLFLGLMIANFWPMSTSPVDTTLRSAMSSLITVVPLMIILSPIIRRLGNEGWHEKFSSTRVIADGRPAAKQLLIPDPKPECDAASTFMLGPYRVGQILHQANDTTVYLGVDTQLNRNVWVHVCEGKECAPSAQRVLLSRSTRQRWLDGGFNDGKRWDAFEAVEGLPIQAVIASRYDADWPEFRKLILDVCEELQVSLDDGTMPETLSLPQVWLDRSGHAKIIDKSLVDVVDVPVNDEDPRTRNTFETGMLSDDPYSSHSSTVATSAAKQSPEQSAVKLLKAIGKSVSRGPKTLPLSAQNFLSELRQQPNSGATLSWAVGRLKKLTGKLGKIDWETRVGILGITVGMEYLLYSIISAFLFLLAFFAIPVPNPSRFFLGLALSLIVPVAIGVIFHGGIVFHLMGISVTNQRGERVGIFKLIARSFLSWLPAMAATGIWMVCIISGNSAAHEPEPGSMAADIRENQMIMVQALAIGFVCFISMAAGVLTSLVSPRRGLQDYLIGTRLTPK